jgi:hypothetical protein
VKARALAVVALLAAAGCDAGEGSGEVTSEKLYVRNCWDGPFDLRPSFFGTTPFENTQEIRIQRGDRNVEVSDGVILVLSDVEAIREQMGEDGGGQIELGLPIGVNPPGFPDRVTTTPPLVSLTIYLYNTCHVQNGALYAVSGDIVFESLFSGDRNENDAKRRLTKGNFRAEVTDPRDAELVEGDGGLVVEYTPEHVSHVEGSFEFYFQRGVPAQPFP